MTATTESRLAQLEQQLAAAQGGKLPATGGGWHPTHREPKYLPEVRYVVNLEAWGRNQMLAQAEGKDPSTVPPVVVEIETTVAWQQCKAAKWEKFQNGVSLGVESIFRDATKEEVAAYLVRKEEALALREIEVAKSELRNAPKVILQNVVQEAAGKKGK